MQAMVLEQFGRPLQWQEVPEPDIGDREALIQVMANGLCATDLKIADGLVPTVPLPHIPGHEVAGQVVAVGAAVPGLSPGDHVTVYPTESCGFCDPCRRGQENYCGDAPRTGFERNGGFAQYMRVAGRNAVKISPEIPWAEAAIIPDAIASVYHALTHRARAQAGETVVIVGVGGLGVHALQLARIMGARVIAADVSPDKLQGAAEFGADVLVNSREEDLPQRVRELTGGAGADVVVETVGGNAVAVALPESVNCLRLGGRLSVLGYNYGIPLAVDTADLIYGQWSILGSRASTLQDVVEVVRLVEQGQLKPVVSEQYPLTQAEQALARLRESPPLGRIVLTS